MSAARDMIRAAYAAVPGKLPLFRALRHLPIEEPLYRHLHFDGEFDTFLSDGTPFRLRSHGDVVENRMFWEGRRGGHERVTMLAWERLARQSTGQILDIGANSGVFACAAKAAQRDAQVTAFEPLRRVAVRLRENVALNRFDIEVVEKAVSNRAGSATIHDSADPDSDGNGYSASLETAFDFNTVSYEVETIRIDDWLGKGDRPVSLVKLDVEMHEPAAIEGMIEMLHRDRPAILIEILNDDVGADVGRQIGGLEYRLFGIDEQRGLVPCERLTPRGGEDRNMLLCTGEQFDGAGLGDLLVGRGSN